MYCSLTRSGISLDQGKSGRRKWENIPVRKMLQDYYTLLDALGKNFKLMRGIGVGKARRDCNEKKRHVPKSVILFARFVTILGTKIWMKTNFKRFP